MNIVRLETVDSTNDEAKRRLERGDVAVRTIITSREQTAGRGTRGRSWASPPDSGLYLTYIDPDPEQREPTTALTIAAAVACCEALGGLGVQVGIKPINDLVVDGRKLGGILTETVVRGGAVTAIVIGVGINLRRDERPVTEDALSPISLEEITSDVPGADVVLHAIAERLPILVDRAGDPSVQATYETRRTDTQSSHRGSGEPLG